jgi:nucleotide-binding universal stress UspA family protein
MSEIPLAHILVPLDGSSLAEQILPVAAGLVRACGRELILLHVLEPSPPERIHGQPHLATAEAAARYLDRISRELAEQRVSCRIAVIAADNAAVATVIARQARALGADLIALTTHGRGGLRGLLFGRIAQQVLQQAERPTLVLRATERSVSLLPETPQHLLIPLDGSPASEHVLPFAWQLARCLAATVTLARVVPTLEHLSFSESAPAVFLPTATAALLELERQHAEQDLQHLAATAPAGLPVTVVVRQGDVVAELAALATEVDLVVMTTHGRAGLPGWLAGSVAARLLERVTIPLLLVPIGRQETSTI